MNVLRFLGNASTYDDCLSAALISPINPFYSITWFNWNYNNTQYAGHCYGVKDISWKPVLEENVNSGRIQGRNIWSRKVVNTNELFDGTIYGLRVDKKRAIRARYPDQDPETSMQYAPLSGWIKYNTLWKPPLSVPNAVDITQNATDWPGVIWPMDGPGNTTWTGEGGML